MKFAHTQDQLDLQQGAREFLRNRCTRETLRGLVEVGKVSLDCWNEFAEMGLLGLMAGSDEGGLGLDANGFALIAEEAGYVALPDPLIEVAGISVPLLESLAIEDKDQWLEQVVSGEQRIRIWHASAPRIHDLNNNDEVLLVVQDRLSRIRGEDLNASAADSIDPLRRLSRIDLDTDNAEILLEGDAAADASRSAFRHGALFTSAEMLGLAAAMIQMATDYAQERKQFGQPIGSYQAVKHHLSNAFVALEFARPVLYRAAAALALEENSADLAIAHARLAAIDAATKAAEVAIQIHGGMGYTFEVDLHLWMKRVWSLSGQWGDRNHHVRVVETALLDNKHPVGPAHSFA